MRKYPGTFLIVGLLILIVGFNIPTNSDTKYLVSIVLCSVGGFVTGISLRYLNK